MLLHAPNDVPINKDSYLKLSLDRDVRIAVEPTFLNTSNDLKDWPPTTYMLTYNYRSVFKLHICFCHRRGCYYQNERKLKFFQVYTEDNCYLECLTNYTERICKCVAFYMPSNSSGLNISQLYSINIIIMCIGYSTTSVCGTNSNYTHWMDLVRSYTDMDPTTGSTSDACACLPSCTLIEYNTELYQSRVNFSRLSFLNQSHDEQFVVEI